MDINDLTIVLANYGQTVATWTQGEFTGDGTVDINDLTIVLANYGEHPRLLAACRRARAFHLAFGGRRPAWRASLRREETLMDRKPTLSLARLAMAIVSIPAAMVPAAADATFVGWWSLSSVTVSGTAMDRWTLTCEPTGSDTVAVAFDVGAEDTAYFVTGNGPLESGPPWTRRPVPRWTAIRTSCSVPRRTTLWLLGRRAVGRRSRRRRNLREGWTTATAVLQIVAPAGEMVNHTTGTLHGLTLEDGLSTAALPGRSCRVTTKCRS